MHLENILIPSDNQEYFADALDVVKIKFINSLENIDDETGYKPDFAHQHFGETEQIIGYKNLSVSICYSEASLFIYPVIKFDEKMKKNESIEADDIIYKIRDQLPSSQLDALITSSSLFAEKLKEQHTFEPFGELISEFCIEEENKKRTFKFYKLEKTDIKEANSFLERAQTLAFWYIDAVCYTDYDDSCFYNYFLFECLTWEDGSPRYIFSGYATLYRFYHYPDKHRVRIAHIMLSPAHRHSGFGIKFLNSIYLDLYMQNKVYDITAESPAENFILMRDHLDCVNCCKLREFSKDELKNGFSKKMENVALEKYKLHNVQARRIYEILRYINTNTKSPTEMEAFKNDLVKRLSKPLFKSKRDFTKFSQALDPKEIAVVSRTVEPEQQQQQIEEAYESTISLYNVIVKRLKKYESNLFH